MRYMFFAISTLLLCQKSWAQDPVYRSITNINGLPSNTVYNIFQDKKGFIWIGHDKGLCRYDGKTFKQYGVKAKKGRSLSNVLEVDGRIWCQDFSGNFFYTEGDSLINKEICSADGGYANSCLFDGNKLGFITSDSVKIFDTKTNSMLALKNREKTNTSVCKVDEKLHFLSKQTLFRMSGNQLQSVRAFKQSLPNIFFLIHINKTFYFFAKNEMPNVFRLDKDVLNPLSVLPSGLFIQDVNVIGGEIWVSTSTGAYCFDADFKPKYQGHCFFKGISITQVMKDREKNYWFGSINKGIFLVTDINVLLHKFENEGATTLQYGRDKQILVGTTNNRILGFDTEKNQYTSLYKEPTNHEVVDIFYDKTSNKTLFCSNRILFLDNYLKYKEINLAGKDLTRLNDKLFVTAFSTGISLISVDKSFPSIPQWLQNVKNTWVNGGFNILDDSPRGRSVFFNVADSTLYTATAKGLFFFSPKEKGEIRYKGKPIYGSQLQYVNNVLYVGSFDEGLYIIKDKYNIVLENEYNSELSKIIYKLHIQGDWVWLVSDNVIQRYNLKTKQLIQYSYTTGLNKAEIKDILLYENKAFIATTEGVIVLNNNNRVALGYPNLVSNHILVNNKVVSEAQLLYLKPSENNIQIDFSLLTFKGENTFLPKYKINDGAWQSMELQGRILNLPLLPSGKYKVSIAAFSELGTLSGNILEYQCHISTPFYKQWWFILLLVLLIGVGIYTYFRWRLNDIKVKNDLLSEKLKLERELQRSMLASIKSQMNPHFLFNALNTIQSYIYTNDKENAAQYLGKFSELTRMILDMSNKESVSLADEIKSLKLYLGLEGLRFEDKLHYDLTIDDNISLENQYIPSMLIQPYVENAIKHGLLHQKHKWQLSISFYKENKVIKVIVDDNGVGRRRSFELNKNKTKQHESFASKANQTRLDILNKGLTEHISLDILDKMDVYGNALGTTVTIRIPILKT